MKKGTKIGLGIASLLAIGLVSWKVSKTAKIKDFDKRCLAGGGEVQMSGKLCNTKDGKTYSESDQTADVYVGDIAFK